MRQGWRAVNGSALSAVKWLFPYNYCLDGALVSRRPAALWSGRTKKKLGGSDVEGNGCGACWFDFCGPGLCRRCANRDQDRPPLCFIRTIRLDLDAGFQRAQTVDRPEERRG